jgi:hypothetical protein
MITSGYSSWLPKNNLILEGIFSFKNAGIHSCQKMFFLTRTYLYDELSTPTKIYPDYSGFNFWCLH